MTNWIFGINCWRPLSFYFSDYGDGRDPRTWVREKLAAHGIKDSDSEIWVQTFPRLFGYVFNPVTFWYCKRSNGSVGAVIEEVNNTFGEKHCYILTPKPGSGEFDDIYSEKVLFVSPFYPLKGGYRFNINTDFDSPKVRIDYFDEGQLQLNTAIWGHSRTLTKASLFSALTRQPFLTFGVIARIHWQALRLWVKGVKIVNRLSTKSEEA